MSKPISVSDILTYRIEVHGHLDSAWSESLGMMVAIVADDPPVTSITGEVDQAGLHGALKKIFAIGLAVISVTIIEPGRSANR